MKRKNLFKRQLFVLHLSGILCPPNWEQNWFKKTLYYTYTLGVAICVPSMFTVLMMYLINHIDDLFKVTAVLFPNLCFITVYINFIYFMRNKSKLLNLIDRMETEFLVHMERVGSPERREVILS
ncbi:hypothetical protein C0J52_13421 [Blattella germanica]|nr:hypothetical protein C0J52_13421 [Blattella germanica]